MLTKWKAILSNWINCFSENGNEQQSVNKESLQLIITHLRENFGLDESKSSILEAHTLEEFLIEKYPEFRFDNESAKETSEQDLYLAASLLLYFVCVNSKDVNIRKAMCSKLSMEDQETIMKFTKVLMKCSAITYQEVHDAIIEACGHETASAKDTIIRKAVTETPPVLRSLHSEVRRLQAALDAERFDRNFLQEELVRTQSRMEKLGHDKNEYKQQILELKTKLSNIGENPEEISESSNHTSSKKLLRQIDDLEQRLVDTRSQLDEVTYDRNTYKTKVNDLKTERDKWLTFVQQETARATALADELATERRNVESLRELVAELRQHNQHNGLDLSQLECDDPDASIHSMAHNASVCSEACANVIEVQLGEERAKIIELRNQIQTLQDQLNELNQKAEEETNSSKRIILERDSDIVELRHRINEEIEEKNKNSTIFDDALSKFNDHIAELELKIKSDNENYTKNIEKKMQEIQVLQEEKLILLQSLNDETTKLEDVIKNQEVTIQNVKAELDTEKNTKQNMKDFYENKLMKLKEKVLNRNNELVELQNNVCASSEKIETLVMEIKKEKETKEELISNFKRDICKLTDDKKALETEIIRKNDEQQESQRELNDNALIIRDLRKEKQDLQNSIINLNMKLKALDNTKSELTLDIETRICELEELQNQIENLKIAFAEKNAYNNQILQEKETVVQSLQAQLQSEISNKVELQNEVAQLNDARISLAEEIHKLNEESAKLLLHFNEKEKMVEALDLYLHQEKALSDKYKKDCEVLNSAVQSMTDTLIKKEQEIKDLHASLESERSLCDQFKHDYYLLIDSIVTASNLLTQTNINIQQIQNSCENEDTRGEQSKLVCKLLSDATQTMTSQIAEKDEKVKYLEHKVEVQQVLCERFKQDCYSLNDSVKMMKVEYETEIKQYQEVIETSQATQLKEVLERDKTIETLNNQLLIKNNLVKELKNTLSAVKEEKAKLIEQARVKANTIVELEEKNEEICRLLGENEMAKNTLEVTLKEEIVKYDSCKSEHDTQVSKLLNRVKETERILKELRSKSNKTIEEQSLELQTMRVEIDKHKRLNETAEKEKQGLLHKRDEEITSREKVEKEYNNQCKILQESTELLNNFKVASSIDLKTLKEENEKLSKILEVKSKEINDLDHKLRVEIELHNDLLHEKDLQIKELSKRVTEQDNTIDLLEDGVKNEIEKRSLEIEALKKENDQLQYTIEDDNSTHELLVKEKENVIEYLEQQLKFRNKQLESVQKDYEEKTLSWVNTKLEMKEIIETKDSLLAKMTHDASQLQDSIQQNVSEIDKLKEKIEELIKERDKMKEQLTQEIMVLRESKAEDMEKVDKATWDSEVLVAELNNAKSLISCLEVEKLGITTDIGVVVTQLEAKTKMVESIKKELEEKELTVKSLSDQIETLLTEKEKLHHVTNVWTNEKCSLFKNIDILTQQKLALENQIQLVAGDKENLIGEIKLLNNEISLEKEMRGKIVSENNNITLEKESLIRELVQMKEAKHIAESEQQKLNLEIQSLSNNLLEAQEYKNNLVAQNEILSEQMFEEKNNKVALSKEKDALLEDNNNLTQKVLDHEAVHNHLMHEKEVLITEKESLVLSLSEEKSVRDAIENEKRDKEIKVVELKQRYDREINSKTEEIIKFEGELKCLKVYYNEKQETISKISSTLMSGLDKLLHALKREDIQNEILQKLISIQSNEISMTEQCDFLVNLADTLIGELAIRRSLEKALEHENSALAEIRDLVKQKEMQIFELQSSTKGLQQNLSDSKADLVKTSQTYSNTINENVRAMQVLKHENEALHSEIKDLRLQVEIKATSFKERIADNEHLTEKLKKTYECQIDNLNLMSNKLTNYLKEKSLELDVMRKEKEKLQSVIEDNKEVIRTLEQAVKSEKLNQTKLINDFESERLVLKNMVTVTESVMEDQKSGLDNAISEHVKTNQALLQDNKALKQAIENEKQNAAIVLKEKDSTFEALFKELSEERKSKDVLLKNMENQIIALKDEVKDKTAMVENSTIKNKELEDLIEKYRNDLAVIQDKNKELTTKIDTLEQEIHLKDIQFTNTLKEQSVIIMRVQTEVKEKDNEIQDITSKNQNKDEEINKLRTKNKEIVNECNELKDKLQKCDLIENEELVKLKKDNIHLVQIIDENKTVITNLEQLIKHELEQNHHLREDNSTDKLNLINKCANLEEFQTKAQKVIDGKDREIASINNEIKDLKWRVEALEQEVKDKNTLINTIKKELTEERVAKEMYKTELGLKATMVFELRQKIEEIKSEKKESLKLLKKENELFAKAVGQRETFAMTSQEKSAGSSQPKYPSQTEDHRNFHQVDMSHSDTNHSSLESIKTITDLEKIINDKNRTITTLQGDVTYLKNIMAESENKLMDVTKELEMSKENCDQLSSQLKKLVHQKNDEISDLKRHLSKMSVTENRASQIIKVSAKYQAIILKRIAEIKSNTVLKELTNFGSNVVNTDNDVRRSLAGSVTMEDLENFLETTDRHLKRCSEKQIVLQKERDRLLEVNRINETEIVNMKKFLTELSVTLKTFGSIKEMYSQKLSRILPLQRSIRRDILNLDGNISDVTMVKLERSYAAAIQDLVECAMNLERWVERSISRAVSPEKIKQAFASEMDRASISSGSFQNASIEVQLDELEKTFQRLLEEVARAPKGEGVRDQQASTVMEVRTEYEDKLSRMKAKMKQLYQEQIQIFREKQKEEISVLERELHKARDKLSESSRAYEEHIRSLTTELWSVGEKLLVEKGEAEWLRRKQRTASLMSLQHVHSSGLLPPHEPPPRPSDTHSMRSLQMHKITKNTGTESRALHMSDEEGEVFDNRLLGQLRSPPRAPERPERLSQLQWRNSLCPPHLRSAYAVETNLQLAADEDDIKSGGGAMSLGGKQRKEVGITAYKKPGPPTPSKQAGRLSATDSELRESLRPEQEPSSRKTGTPSRLRSLFRSNKNDTNEGTPRSRRLSFFRAKK